MAPTRAFSVSAFAAVAACAAAAAAAAADTSSAAAAASLAASLAAARARASTPRAPAPGGHSAETLALLASYRAALAARNATSAARAPGARDDVECGLDLVSYELALALQPERAPLADVFYALSLDSACGLAPPPGSPYAPLHLAPLTDAQLRAACLPQATFFVDSARGDDGSAGSLAAPFRTLAPRALAAARAARAPGAGTACVVLRGGAPHYLGAAGTQVLTAADSGLIVTGYDGDGEPDAWISGGTPLAGLAWAPYDTSGGRNVYVATVPAGVASVPGLQTIDPIRRYSRAQFPNFDFEVDGRKWIDASQPRVIAGYINPPNYGPVTQYNVTLFPALKNDSTMMNYNNYCTGSGGPTALWQGGIDGERGWNCERHGGKSEPPSNFVTDTCSHGFAPPPPPPNSSAQIGAETAATAAAPAWTPRTSRTASSACRWEWFGMPPRRSRCPPLRAGPCRRARTGASASRTCRPTPFTRIRVSALTNTALTRANTAPPRKRKRTLTVIPRRLHRPNKTQQAGSRCTTPSRTSTLPTRRSTSARTACGPTEDFRAAATRGDRRRATRRTSSTAAPGSSRTSSPSSTRRASTTSTRPRGSSISFTTRAARRRPTLSSSPLSSRSSSTFRALRPRPLRT